MLTRMRIRNFKLFEDVEIELGERVVFVGPNNSGKTSALQALALWNAGVRRWVEKRGSGNIPRERAGVTLNPLFRSFCPRLTLPNLMARTDDHTLAPFVRVGQIDPEVREKLDRIVEVANAARPAKSLDE